MGTGGKFQRLLGGLFETSARIEHKGSTRQTRNDIPEQFDPLGGQRRFEIGEARDVPTGMRQACNQSALDRIGDGNEYDRDSLGFGPKPGNNPHTLAYHSIWRRAKQVRTKRLDALLVRLV